LYDELNPYVITGARSGFGFSKETRD